MPLPSIVRRSMAPIVAHRSLLRRVWSARVPCSDRRSERSPWSASRRSGIPLTGRLTVAIPAEQVQQPIEPLTVGVRTIVAGRRRRRPGQTAGASSIPSLAADSRRATPRPPLLTSPRQMSRDWRIETAMGVGPPRRTIAGFVETRRSVPPTAHVIVPSPDASSGLGTIRSQAVHGAVTGGRSGRRRVLAAGDEEQQGAQCERSDRQRYADRSGAGGRKHVRSGC